MIFQKWIWPCGEVDQSQPRITTQTYILGPSSTVLHTNAHGCWSFGLRDDVWFSYLICAVQPFLSYDLEYIT